MMKGKWIANRTASPFYARKEFTLTKRVTSAQLDVIGLGQYNFYLNGQKVSEDILEPAWTDYDKTLLYAHYDVTALLNNGDNAMGIETGNGWFILDDQKDHGYSFHFPSFMPPNPNPYRPFGKYLCARVCLTLFYTDGTQEEIISDESWKTYPHMVAWTNVYGSEYIDGTKKPEGDWTQSDFNDGDWQKAYLLSGEETPKGKLIQRTNPPIRVIHEYEARYLHEVNGMRVYDLGQNIAGILSAELSGKEGETIEFITAEKLDENGLPDQMAKNWMLIDNTIHYVIGKTGVKESFSQVFTYFSGRYIGVRGNAEIHYLCGKAITSAWKEAGTFRSTDEKLSQIYDMIEKTVEANMVSVHTDCPTIERFAWQEPNHLMAPSIFFMKDVKELWRKFLADCRDAQHTENDRFRDFAGNSFCPGDGLVPSQAPCYIPNVLPVPGMGSFYDIIGWGSTIILGTRWHYLFNGDEGIIKENYEAGMRYFRYLLTKLDDNGFISHGLGDWGNPDGIFARENVETALLYADACALEEFAVLLGEKDDTAFLKEEKEKILTHYNDQLLVQDEEGRWCYRCYEKKDEGIVMSQACEALPLYWNMVPEDKKEDVIESFRKTLEERNSFVSGEIGLPYIIQTAAANGMNDLVYSFITEEEHPSYYAFIKAGETTLGEYWEDNPRSHCHDMMGHIIEWYYRSIAGINPVEPGFKKVHIEPWMPKDMNSFICSYETSYGLIEVRGTRENGTPHFEITVPEGIERV